MSSTGGNADQRQVRDDSIDQFIITEDRLRISTGRDDHRIGAILAGILFHESPDQPANARKDAKDHGIAGRFAEGTTLGTAEFDVGQGIREFMHRTKLHRCARCDGAAMERAFAVDEVDGDCGTAVHDDAGLLHRFPRGQRIEQSIGSCDGLGVEPDHHRDGDVGSDLVDLFGELILDRRSQSLGNRFIDVGHEDRRGLLGGLLPPEFDHPADCTGKIIIRVAAGGTTGIAFCRSDVRAGIADTDHDEIRV